MSKLRETLTSQQDTIESLRSQIISWKEQNSQLHGQLKSIENLEQQLEAAKLREAELQRSIDNWDIVQLQPLRSQWERMKQERDAALSALEIARTALLQCSDPIRSVRWIRQHASTTFRQLEKLYPSAALAERDRIGREES